MGRPKRTMTRRRGEQADRAVITSRAAIRGSNPHGALLRSMLPITLPRAESSQGRFDRSGWSTKKLVIGQG